MSTYFVVNGIPGACRELDSSFAALSAVKEELDNDRKALSVAEASLNADKSLMEQRTASARYHMQCTIAEQVRCICVSGLDAAAAVLRVNTPNSALHAGGQLIYALHVCNPLAPLCMAMTDHQQSGRTHAVTRVMLL